MHSWLATRTATSTTRPRWSSGTTPATRRGTAIPLWLRSGRRSSRRRRWRFCGNYPAEPTFLQPTIGTTMKTILCIVVCCCAGLASAQEKVKGLNVERLMSKDANKDGKLSKEELGEKFWKRSAGQDANGDGVLDAKEIEGLRDKSKGK